MLAAIPGTRGARLTAHNIHTLENVRALLQKRLPAVRETVVLGRGESTQRPQSCRVGPLGVLRAVLPGGYSSSWEDIDLLNEKDVPTMDSVEPTLFYIEGQKGVRSQTLFLLVLGYSRFCVHLSDELKLICFLDLKH